MMFILVFTEVGMLMSASVTLTCSLNAEADRRVMQYYVC